ncbi:TPA: HEAT repeat domain-containing protein, partial [Legionella pneumophila]|nr:hypothetical protein [Legionella pneumophila]HBD7339209.1 HEAT repeat domain-containing protein [Legionella pneumophila]
YSISVIDISNLIKLIKDDRYIICSNAIKTSNSLIDGSVYQVIIEKLKDIDRFTRKIYILQLQKNDILIDTLNNNLISTQDISIKELCYEIIYQIGASFHFFQLAMKDVEETKGECQLAAIRVFAKSNPEKAKDTLYSLLKSQNWLIRNTVIQGISDVKTPETFDELVKCLDDNNYLVRTKAAKSLSNISDESRSLLIKYEENDSSRFQDIATYFLDIYEKREQ